MKQHLQTFHFIIHLITGIGGSSYISHFWPYVLLTNNGQVNSESFPFVFPCRHLKSSPWRSSPFLLGSSWRWTNWRNANGRAASPSGEINAHIPPSIEFYILIVNCHCYFDFIISSSLCNGKYLLNSVLPSCWLILIILSSLLSSTIKWCIPFYWYVYCLMCLANKVVMVHDCLY